MKFESPNKKVAIITINDNSNIGNRLQNYAVQELLKKKGCKVETILYYASNNNESVMYNIKAYINALLTKCGFITTIKKRKDPRVNLCDRFNNDRLTICKKYVLKSRNMKRYSNAFDFYCIGSDQIWNYGLVQNNDFFFGGFTDSRKVFSFSASMGNACIGPKYLQNFKSGFNHVGTISVREKELKDLVEEITGKSVTLLLDPTLLLDRREWIKVAHEPGFDVPKSYIVTYFLSEQTIAQKEYIKKFARLNDCGIIDMNGLYRDQIGPSEFVYLISHSQFVFTDSFHGTAFSIIFNKNFIVFNRNNMYDMSSRITTLLKTMDLINHYYSEDNNELDDSFLNHLYDLPQYNVEKIIEKEKEKAFMFLNHCLKGNLI